MCWFFVRSQKKIFYVLISTRAIALAVLFFFFLPPLSSFFFFNYHQCRSFMDHLHGCWGRGVGPRWPQTTSHPLSSRVDKSSSFKLPPSRITGPFAKIQNLQNSDNWHWCWPELDSCPLLFAMSTPLTISETKRRIQLVIAPGDK